MPNTRIAICYDFDHTLSPGDMQTFSFIPSIGMAVDAFWHTSNTMAVDHQMNRTLSCLKMMLDQARLHHIPMTRSYLTSLGRDIVFFPGVDTWFDRVNAFSTACGVHTEHYVLSSGLREIIAGSAVAAHMTCIYASGFYFDEQGLAAWPAQAISEGAKTQYLFRISKGVLNENDERVNERFDADAPRIPFTHMIYIGDSETDIPCMALLRARGGLSVGVYDPNGSDALVQSLMRDERIDAFAPADYRAGMALENIVLRFIKRCASSPEASY